MKLRCKKVNFKIIRHLLVFAIVWTGCFVSANAQKYEIGGGLGGAGRGGQGRGRGASSPDPSWSLLFSVHHLSTANTAFAGHIATDGVGASVYMLGADRQGKPQRKSMPGHRRRWLEDYHHDYPVNVGGKWVVAVDPGAHMTTAAATHLQLRSPALPLTAGEVHSVLHGARPVHGAPAVAHVPPLPKAQPGQPGAKPRILQRSVQAFHHGSGAKAWARWQQRKLQLAGNGLRAWQSAIPPLQGATTEQQVIANVQYVLQRLPELLQHYGMHQQRQQRWRCHIGRQRAMHEHMLWLLNGHSPSSTIIAWGNGSAGRGSCISRGAGFPQLQFLNYLRYQGVEVRVVDEHLTTQASADKG